MKAKSDSTNRRDFLIAAGGFAFAGAGIWAGRTLFSQSPSVGISTGTVLGGGEAILAGTPTPYLGMLDLKLRESSLIPLKFRPHGVSFHPTKKNTVAAFEKKGPGASEINLLTGDVTATIEASAGHAFYGHGAYSTDGNFLYSVETDLTSRQGAIVVRDAESFQEVGRVPSFGESPHDCILRDGGKVMAITNGGGTKGGSIANVAYVELASGKLLQKYEIQDDRFNAGHLAISDAGELVVVSAPRQGLADSELGAISFLNRRGKLETVKRPEELVTRLKSETLSIAIDDPRGVAGITSPGGGFVSFWDLSTQSLLAKVDLPNPRGILLTSDGSHYLVSLGTDGGVVVINASTYKENTEFATPNAGFSGSHLYLSPASHV